ncbi:hypothetical protein NQ314_001125 [Rhamnusium bicolor]|uniref:Uncharacterized protein n=1 Tax=Rhamnusium bicolor TaxID=1586634 RepID=A0AAV8ZSP1_9CUCU|nr:hypothetical protein NQ314_001125 [Rhamnusium bicolor]
MRQLQGRIKTSSKDAKIDYCFLFHIKFFPFQPFHDDAEYNNRRANSGRRTCDTEQIEYRLTKLEVQVGEKSAQLTSELREGNRRLQALEYQSAEVQTALEGFRNELGRFTESSQRERFQQPVDYQESNDNTLLHQYDHLTTKQFLTNALIEVKHQQLYPQIPPHLFREPSGTESNSTIPRNCKEIQESGEC